MLRIEPHNLLRHFSFETDTWERLLEYYKQEILSFQFRLSEIINETDDPDMLLQAERFNEDFIGQDFATNYLMEEVYKLNLLLNKHPEPGTEAYTEAENNYLKLKEDILKEESMFRDLKSQYFQFLEKYS